MVRIWGRWLRSERPRHIRGNNESYKRGRSEIMSITPQNQHVPCWEPPVSFAIHPGGIPHVFVPWYDSYEDSLRVLLGNGLFMLAALGRRWALHKSVQNDDQKHTHQMHCSKMSFSGQRLQCNWYKCHKSCCILRNLPSLVLANSGKLPKKPACGRAQRWFWELRSAGNAKSNLFAPITNEVGELRDELTDVELSDERMWTSCVHECPRITLRHLQNVPPLQK